MQCKTIATLQWIQNDIDEFGNLSEGILNSNFKIPSSSNLFCFLIFWFFFFQILQLVFKCYLMFKAITI